MARGRAWALLLALVLTLSVRRADGDISAARGRTHAEAQTEAQTAETLLAELSAAALDAESAVVRGRGQGKGRGKGQAQLLGQNRGRNFVQNLAMNLGKNLETDLINGKGQGKGKAGTETQEELAARLAVQTRAQVWAKQQAKSMARAEAQQMAKEQAQLQQEARDSARTEATVLQQMEAELAHAQKVASANLPRLARNPRLARKYNPPNQTEEQILLETMLHPEQVLRKQRQLDAERERKRLAKIPPKPEDQKVSSDRDDSDAKDSILNFLEVEAAPKPWGKARPHTPRPPSWWPSSQQAQKAETTALPAMSLSDIASRALGGVDGQKHSAGVSDATAMGGVSLSDIARSAFRGMNIHGLASLPSRQQRIETARSDGTASASNTIRQLQHEQQLATPPTSLLSMSQAGRHYYPPHLSARQINFHQTQDYNSMLQLHAGRLKAMGNQIPGMGKSNGAFRSELFDSFNSRLRNDAAEQFSSILNKAESHDNAQEAKAREVGAGEFVHAGLPSVSVSSSAPVDPTLTMSSGDNPFAGQIPPPSGVKYSYASNSGSGLPPPPPPPDTPPPPRLLGTPPPVSSPYALRNEMQEHISPPAPVSSDGIDHSFLPKVPPAKSGITHTSSVENDKLGPQGAPATPQTIPI